LKKTPIFSPKIVIITSTPGCKKTLDNHLTCLALLHAWPSVCLQQSLPTHACRRLFADRHLFLLHTYIHTLNHSHAFVVCMLCFFHERGILKRDLCCFAYQLIRKPGQNVLIKKKIFGDDSVSLPLRHFRPMLQLHRVRIIHNMRLSN
jgi:hypothetical protein